MAMKEHRAFAVCIHNEGYEVSLEMRKIYPVLPVENAERDHRLVRVVDESGEDYLYPQEMFVELELPEKVREAFAPVA